MLTPRCGHSASLERELYRPEPADFVSFDADLLERPRGAELYDLAADAREQRDLAASQPVRVEELAQVLARARGSEPARPVEALEHEGLDEEMTERLRELGYLDE